MAGRMIFACFVFLMLVASYLGVYSGSIHSIDEMSSLAVTASLVKFGALSSNQTLWVSARRAPPDARGPSGDQYSKYGLAVSAAAAPLYLLGLHFEVGGAHAAMLVDAIATAATGALLCLVAVRLGYPTGVGLSTALLFGLATPAFVYAKYLFGEPLTALGLIGAMAGLLAARRGGGSWLGLVAGMGCGFAVASRVAVAPLALAFGLYALAPDGRLDGRRRLARTGLFTLGFGLFAVLVGLYNWLRFEDLFQTGYGAGETFSTPLLEGLAGLVASPGRGLIVYAPALLLALPGLALWPRRHRAEAILSLTIVAYHFLLYAGWFMWWGGNAWGPRFLLPTLPFLAVLAAPAIHRLLDGSTSPTRWTIPARSLAVLLLMASLGIQAIGVAVNFNDLPHPAESASPINWHWEQWPVLGALRLLADGRADLAWLVSARSGFAVDWPTLLLPLAATAVAGAGLLVGRRADRRDLSLGLAVAGMVLAGLASAAIVARHANETAGEGAHYRSLLRDLAARAQPADAIVSNMPLHIEWLLNYNRVRLPEYGLARDSLEKQPDLADLLARVLRDHERVWFAVEWTPVGDPGSGVERWLDERAYKVSNDWYGDAGRLALYLTPRAERASWVSVEPSRLGQVAQLEGYQISLPRDGAPTGQVNPGDPLRVALRWRALQPTSERYKVFLQLVGPDGKLLLQRDREPVDHFRPTSTWRVGEEVIDRYGLLLPDPSPSGRYRLITGLYHAPSGARLPILGEDGQARGDYLTLLEVTVR